MYCFQERRPNFRTPEGDLFLVRCFACSNSERGKENWGPAVASGTCAWCGWEDTPLDRFIAHIRSKTSDGYDSAFLNGLTVWYRYLESTEVISNADSELCQHHAFCLENYDYDNMWPHNNLWEHNAYEEPHGLDAS